MDLLDFDTLHLGWEWEAEISHQDVHERENGNKTCRLLMREPQGCRRVG